MSTRLAARRDAGLLISTWNVRPSALSVSVQTQSSKSKITSKSKKKAATFVPKKYRPPHPIGVKGGCSPQNNRRKLFNALSEVSPAGNKILHKTTQKFSGSSAIGSSTVNEGTRD